METEDRRKTDVCVVGAGFAGIAAALRATANGQSVIVLEARDRVGGRVWNKAAPDGTLCSVGGTWLGKDQDRMFALCKEFGFDVYPQYDTGETVMHLGGKNMRYAGRIPKLDPFALVSLGLGFARLNALVKDVPLETPWTAPYARGLDARSLGDWVADWWNVPNATARLLMRTALMTLFTCDISEVSVLGSLVLARGGGSFEYYTDSSMTETHLVDGGGSPELITAMAARLGDAVRLSAPVRQISQTADGVRVIADDTAVDARYVIVTVPPTLASQIAYDPALPLEHEYLLRRMPTGAIIRMVTLYDEPFWRADGLSGMSVAPDLPIAVALDQTPRSGKPGMLSSYAVGPKALELAALEPEKRREIWLNALAARYGPKALSPIACIEADWAAERWSLGGMISHFPPGVLTSYGHVLHQPAGRIYWAGSERATAMHGLMEGAVRSGELAADQVLAAAS